jgi:hypothetical protein
MAPGGSPGALLAELERMVIPPNSIVQ